MKPLLKRLLEKEESCEDFWNKVYDLLVSIGGANESARNQFIMHQMDSEYPPREYRFQGVFGFGGKLWRTHDALDVSYYQEHASKRLDAIQSKLNEELAKLSAVSTCWKLS